MKPVNVNEIKSADCAEDFILHAAAATHWQVPVKEIDRTQPTLNFLASIAEEDGDTSTFYEILQPYFMSTNDIIYVLPTFHTANIAGIILPSHNKHNPVHLCVTNHGIFEFDFEGEGEIAASLYSDSNLPFAIAAIRWMTEKDTAEKEVQFIPFDKSANLKLSLRRVSKLEKTEQLMQALSNIIRESKPQDS